jgi:hypothetical protein
MSQLKPPWWDKHEQQIRWRGCPHTAGKLNGSTASHNSKTGLFFRMEQRIRQGKWESVSATRTSYCPPTVFSIISRESSTVCQHLRFLCWPSSVLYYRLFAEVDTKVPSTNNFQMQCLLQTCCIGSYYLCHWRYMTPEWTLYQRQHEEEPYHQANESSSDESRGRTTYRTTRPSSSPSKRSSVRAIRDENCQDVRGLRRRERAVGRVESAIRDWLIDWWFILLLHARVVSPRSVQGIGQSSTNSDWVECDERQNERETLLTF